ncbi:GH92 family glycosyl hydrolase [Chitinophaga polysaccharea]|uniref:GH92 family glycosyl hydrolase n=1 Tax=Chitinophaga polysaccharea TaxID=1293035 RepID=UPI00115BCEE8|nr:GH92 family glycosyl hydrolase [Chitinophaga polysaccharea]
MKQLFLYVCGWLICSISMAQDPVSFVNPLVGTASSHDLSNGNTYPAIAVPWGMNFWTPQTGKMGDGWTYTYDAAKIVGFKQTHQPSPWMNDYGQFSIMPITRRAVFKEADRGSWFSHKAEIATPYYYSVYLADYDIKTEIAPTERAAAFRFTYPATDSAFVVVDAMDMGSYIKIIPGERKIIGYTTRNKGGVPGNFRDYFVLLFDRPFTVSYLWKDGALIKDLLEASAGHTGAVIGFPTGKGTPVNVKAASSFISPAQAELNLQREIAGDNFETVKQHARDTWNKYLDRVTIEGGSDKQTATFYSCLYRCMLFPQRHYEIDAAGEIVHYSPYNGKVMPGKLYAGTGFWDTFRSLYPLLNLLYPDINREMQEGLVNAYKEGGWLPEWSSPGYRNIMVGNNSASVVADAYLKGIRGYDIDTLYQALLKDANNEGPMTAVGRKGVAFYNRLGYVPFDAGINESAARTLEYAYDDFTIYQLAKALKRPQEEIDLYAKRCQNYRHLFDASSGLMRGKNTDGSFQAPFSPVKWGGAFTEGNSWHYSWSVFHDIQGLIDLMGGERMFSSMLDSVFNMPPVFDESYYKKVIHEIREMQVMNIGQYAHGNQPIQHMIYLYNYAGEPWKTQYWVREVMNRLYLPTPDGYCGDEDNGQTSSWYIFSALGFYPVCPATDQYVLGAPLFKKATLHLQNGKNFIIKTTDNDVMNRYVRSVQLNGKAYHKNWISYNELQKGGSMKVKMSAVPDKSRGTDKSAYPYSFSK